MNIPLLDNRVRSLEEMMADLIATVAQTSIEMREFKEESAIERKNFKAEMRKIRDEGAEERRNFSAEMREFRDRVDLDIETGRREHRELNQKLGAIANKQGRMAEDLVAPSICRILRQVLDLPSSYECNQTERARWHNSKIRGKMKEFDVIAECGDYVLVTETKSSPKVKDIADLLKTIGEFRDYFPAYKDKKIIGCLASLYADESLIKYASRKGILILAVGEELMDIMNEPGFKPAEF